MISTKCKLCDGDIELADDDGMFRTKPFPICDECLDTLKELIKEKKEKE